MTERPLETVRRALDTNGSRVQSRGPQKLQASCPVPSHGKGSGDRNPSLSVSESADGNALIHCQSGCETPDVLQALGLEERDLFADTGETRNVYPIRSVLQPRVLPERPKTPGGYECGVSACQTSRKVQAHESKSDPIRCLAEYVYTDSAGAHVGLVHRWEPKNFRPFTPTGDGKGWRAGGTFLVPYALPRALEVLASGGTLLVVEGEKDAETVNACGFTDLAATSNAFGAGKWTDTHSQALAAAGNSGSIVVVGDNDEPGRKAAEKTADSLGRVLGTRPLVVYPARGKDVTEHLDNGGTLDESATGLRPVRTYARLGSVLSLEDLDNLPPIRPLIDGYLSTPSAALLVGGYGLGKSAFTLSMACSVASGTTFLGQAVEQRRVLYVVGEGVRGLPRRVRAWKQTWGRDIPDGALCIMSKPRDSLKSPETWTELSAYCLAEGFGFVILDTFSSLAPDADETKDAALIVAGLNRLAEDIDGTALLVHHPGWSDMSKGRARGGYQLEGNVDEVLVMTATAEDSDHVSVKVKKRKDGEAGKVYVVRRLQVKLPETDEDGRPVTSVTVEGASVQEASIPLRSRIIAYLQDMGDIGASPAQIAAGINADRNAGAFGKALGKIVTDGDASRTGAGPRVRYVIAEE